MLRAFASLERNTEDKTLFYLFNTYIFIFLSQKQYVHEYKTSKTPHKGQQDISVAGIP